jgi:hypothetical protein
MRRFSLTRDFEADCISGDSAHAGEAYHVVRNAEGGALLTPVVRYFAWRPKYSEGVHEHWRVDCFVRVHELAPEPIIIGRAIVDALVREGLCDEPIWLSVHRAEELKGEAFGEVFDYD